jgi:hypothetical protein
MSRKLLFIVMIILLALGGGGAAYAQATGGSITGQVLDANGGAVANATVNLKNEATGQQLTTQTTSAGAFSFPNVLVGDYTATIEGQGFQSVSQRARVLLNQESTISIVLQPAGVTGTVEVTAASEALLNTDNSQLSRNFDTRQVQDLPIFNDVRSLALLSPNVTAQGVGVNGEGGAVGGTRPNSNTFNVDGVDNNDPSVTGQQITTIQDAISEVAILTNNYNAEYGTGSGGQFNTITKSGTNEFHGSGFLYFQSQHLNAATTSEEASIKRGDLLEKPQYREPRYGFTLGGPIVKNKLFFFGALQRDEISQVGAGTSFTAPTAAGLAQISALPGASPFVIDLLKNNLTLPNTATGTQTVLGTPGIPFGEVSIVTPGGSAEKQYQLNIDYLRGTTDQFRFRYTQDDINLIQPGGGNAKFSNTYAQPGNLFSTAWVRTLSPSLVNELRLSYKRFKQDYVLSDQSFNSFPNLTVPTLNLALGPNSNLPQGGLTHSYQIYDAVNLIKGQHTLKFGFETRFIIFTSFFLPRGRGDYVYTDFDELIRDNAPTNVDLRGVGSAAFTGNQRKYYGFAQDDWKVTPNLTLNLGVRYEYLTLPRDSALQGLNAIASVPGVIEFNVPKTDKNNFAPRVGLAYSPQFGGRVGRFLTGERGKSTIRANFSLSYYEVFQNLALLNLPPQFQQEQAASNFPGLAFNFLQQGGVPPNPIPPNTPADARANTASLIVDTVQPYNMAWALSFQREITPSTVLEFRYLHTTGRHLPVQTRRNIGVVDYSKLIIPTYVSAPSSAQLAGLPTLGSLGLDIDPVTGANNRFPGALSQYGFGGQSVTAFDPVGNSMYDGGAVSLTRRFTRGFSLTGAYTYSATFDDSTNELFSSTVNPRRPQTPFNLRDEWSRSAIDVPHRFVASAVYDVPLFAKSDNNFLRNVFGGWQIAGVFQTQSGQLITPQSGIDSNRDRDAAGDRTIVNAGGVPGTGTGVIAVDATGAEVGVGDPATVAYVAINPNAQYIQAGYGARANAGRNTLRTNDWNRTDMVFLKNLRFGEEKYSLQLGAEVGNLFNQRIRTIGDYGSPFFANQADPNGTNQFGIGATSFAFPIVDSGNFNDYSIGNFSGRTIQLRAKFIF